jgi:hypothetical protein
MSIISTTASIFTLKSTNDGTRNRETDQLFEEYSYNWMPGPGWLYQKYDLCTAVISSTISEQLKYNLIKPAIKPARGSTKDGKFETCHPFI